MRVIIDTREQHPWTFEGQSITTTKAKLEAGDYSIEGLERRVAIERKSIDDWVGTVMRERARFYRELELLRALDFRCVIIETGVREIMEGAYKSAARPESLLGFVAEIAVAQSVPVYLAGSRAEAQVLAGAFLKMAAKKLLPATQASRLGTSPTAAAGDQ
jgi:DNA excision repair protein ERCC-4